MKFKKTGTNLSHRQQSSGRTQSSVDLQLFTGEPSFRIETGHTKLDFTELPFSLTVSTQPPVRTEVLWTFYHRMFRLESDDVTLCLSSLTFPIFYKKIPQSFFYSLFIQS